ncbi:MAG: tetratricopeptide repeat protein, partial [Spirulinaceae cyanobacterium]
REVTVAIDGAAKAIEASRTFEGLEVVELTIASETTQCPYAVLPLGDSSQVEQGDAVYLGGFVQPPGTDVTEQDLLATTVEQVLTIPITGGYRLGYTTDAQPSLPGNIMLNLQGQVVGIHGPVAEDSLNARSQGLGWAIPLRSYLIAVEGGGDAVDQAQQVQDQADQLFSAQRYEEALVAYEQLARLRPERPEPWYGQGSSLYNLNRYEDAIAAYDKALEIRPENALIWYSRGNAYFLIQDYEAAQESYENAVRYEADYFTAMNNLGLTFQALEQYDTALELYEAVIELRPEYPSAWNNKGTILSLRRDWPGALAAYDQAIALRPTFSNAWYNRAIVYSQQNDIPRALENLKEAIALRKVWAEEAQADINFQKLKDNPEFQALVN